MTESVFDIRAVVTEDRRLTDAVQCYACGVSLGGAQLDGETPDGDEDLDGICPQCGSSMRPSLSYAIAARAGWLDADDRLNIDHACESCKYNVRTQRIGDHCPECNAVIAPQFTYLWLRFADPEWLRRMLAAARRMLAAIVLPWITVPICVSLAFYGPADFDWIVGPVGLAIALGTLGFPFVTMLYLAAQDPHGGTDRASLLVSRIQMQVGAATTLCGCAVGVVSGLATGYGRGELSWIVIVWIGGGVAILGFIAYACALSTSDVVSREDELKVSSANFAVAMYFGAPFLGLFGVLFELGVYLLLLRAVCKLIGALKFVDRANTPT